MAAPAVLLLNLGSPKSTSVADVTEYLEEFLGDERVIDRPESAFLRSILVKRIIIPKRVRNSAHAYSTIWTDEGSPLIVTSIRTRDALRAAAACRVEAAMNYGEPSIGDALHSLKAAGVDRVLLFPQYPHYAMSSWETVVAKTRREAATIAPEMRLESVMPYFSDDDHIEALVESARPYLAKPHDHLLFSYHGIPVRHLTKADSSHAHCQVVPDCCRVASPAHATCYKAQLTRTTAAFAARAGSDALLDLVPVATRRRTLVVTLHGPRTRAPRKRRQEEDSGDHPRVHHRLPRDARGDPDHGRRHVQGRGGRMVRAHSLPERPAVLHSLSCGSRRTVARDFRGGGSLMKTKRHAARSLNRLSAAKFYFAPSFCGGLLGPYRNSSPARLFA